MLREPSVQEEMEVPCGVQLNGKELRDLRQGGSSIPQRKIGIVSPLLSELRSERKGCRGLPLRPKMECRYLP